MGGAAAYTHFDLVRTQRQIIAVWACWTASFLAYAGAVFIMSDIPEDDGTRGMLVAALAVCSVVLVGATYNSVQQYWFSSVFQVMAMGVVCVLIVLYVSAAVYRKFLAQGPLAPGTFFDPMIVLAVYTAGSAIAGALYLYFRYKAKGVVEQAQDLVGHGITQGIGLLDRATNPGNLDQWPSGKYTSNRRNRNIYWQPPNSRISYALDSPTGDLEEDEENARDKITLHNAWDSRFARTRKALQHLNPRHYFQNRRFKRITGREYPPSPDSGDDNYYEFPPSPDSDDDYYDSQATATQHKATARAA